MVFKFKCKCSDNDKLLLDRVLNSSIELFSRDDVLKGIYTKYGFLSARHLSMLIKCFGLGVLKGRSKKKFDYIEPVQESSEVTYKKVSWHTSPLQVPASFKADESTKTLGKVVTELVFGLEMFESRTLADIKNMLKDIMFEL